MSPPSTAACTTCKTHFEVTEIYGFRFAYVNNRVRYKRTMARNLVTVPQALRVSPV